MTQSTYSGGHIITTESGSNTEYGVTEAPFALHTVLRRSCVPRGSSTGATWLAQRQNCFSLTQDISMPLISDSSETYAPALVFGVGIDLPLAASSSEVYDPSIDSSLLLTMPLAASSSEVYAPDLDAEQFLTLPLAASSSEVYAPDTDEQQFLTLPLVASSSEVYGIDTDEQQFLTLPLAASSSEVYAPDTDEQQFLTLPLIASSSEVYSPDTDEQQFITLPLAASSSEVYAFDLDEQQFLILPLAASSSEVYNPSLDSTILLTLPLAASSSEVYAPELDVQQSLTLPLAASSSETYNPSLDSAILLTLPLAASSSEVYDPSIDSSLLLTMPLAASSSEVYAPEVCPVQMFVPSSEYATLPLAVADIPTGSALTCPYEINISGSTTYDIAGEVYLTNITASAINTVTLQAWAGTTAESLPIFTGSLTIPRTMQNADVEYVTFDGLHFLNCHQNGAMLKIGDQLPSPNVVADYATVKNCIFEQTTLGSIMLQIEGRDCISVDTDGTTLVENCLFTSSLGQSPHPAQAIRAISSGRMRNLTVQDNTFRNIGRQNFVDSGCIQFTGVRAAGNIVRRNKFIDYHTQAISVSRTEDFKIINNLFYSSVTTDVPGVTPFGLETAIAMTKNINGMEILYNTLVNKSSEEGSGSLIVFPADPLQELTGTVTVKNNLLRYHHVGTASVDGCMVAWDASTPDASASMVNSISDYNLYSRVSSSGPDEDSTVGVLTGAGLLGMYASLSDWQDLSFSPDANSVGVSGAIVNLFTDEANDDYTLAPGSLAGQHADPTASVTTDIDGVLRSTTFPSIGCYETWEASLTLPLVASASETYTPGISSSLSLTLPLAASASEVYAPELDVQQLLTLPLVASASEVYALETCPIEMFVPSAEYATLPLAIADIPTGTPLSCSYVINLSGSTTYFHNNLPLNNIEANENNFVTLQATPGTSTESKPIIDGSGAAFYIFGSVNVDYTVIDGIHFKTWNEFQSGLLWGSNVTQVISGTVKNCTIDATNGGKYGLRIAGVSATNPTKGLVVENCFFTGTLGSAISGTDGIRATAVENITVQDCSFTGWTNSGAEGSAMWFLGSGLSAPGQVGGHTIRRNRIFDNDADGIKIGDQENVTIVNNLFYNSVIGVGPSQWVGSRILLESNIDGLEIFYNTMVMKNSFEPSGALIKSVCGAALSGTAQIENNLYRYNHPGAAPGAIIGWNTICGDGSASMASSTTDFNLYSVVNPAVTDYEVFVDASPGIYYTLADWQANSFNPDANSLAVSGSTVNIFTDEANHDYTLQPGSPAGQAATPIAGITTDINGVARSPTLPSIGCYEPWTPLITLPLAASSSEAYAPDLTQQQSLTLPLAASSSEAYAACESYVFSNTKSILFDTGSSVNSADRLKVTSDSGLADLPFGSGSFSVSAWFKRDTDFTFERTIISRWSDSAALKDFKLSGRSSQGRFEFQLKRDDGGTSAAVCANTYNDGFWHFIAAGWDGTDIFLDVDGGAERITATAATRAGSANGEVLTIGALSSLTANRGWIGNLDEVSFWSKGLSADDCVELYTNEDAENCPKDLGCTGSLVSWWRMGDDPRDSTDIDAGGLIHDVIGGHNATPVELQPGDIVIETPCGPQEIEMTFSAVGEAYAPEINQCPVQIYVPSDSHPLSFNAIQDAIEAIPHGVALTCSYEVLISGSTTYNVADAPIVLTNMTTTAEFDIKILAQVGTTGSSKPLISGDATANAGTGQAPMWIKDVDFVTVDGIGFVDWSWTGTPTTTSNPPGRTAIALGTQSLFGTGTKVDNITIISCSFDAQSGGQVGITINSEGITGNQGCDDVEIGNCEFTGTLGDEDKGNEAITGWYLTNGNVHHNLFQGWDDGMILLTLGGSLGSCNITANRFNNICREAIWLAGQDNCNIVNNEVFLTGDCDPSLLHASFIYCAGDVDNLIVGYNTVVAKSSSLPVAWFDTLAGSTDDHTWVNNLFRYESPGNNSRIMDFDDAAQITALTVMDFNCYSLVECSPEPTVDDNVAWCATCDGGSQEEYPTLALWQATSGEDTNSIDPCGVAPGIFKNESTYDLTIPVGSPVSGAATPYPGITTDINGNPRSPTDPTIGCHEAD